MSFVYIFIGVSMLFFMAFGIHVVYAFFMARIDCREGRGESFLRSFVDYLREGVPD